MSNNPNEVRTESERQSKGLIQETRAGIKTLENTQGKTMTTTKGGYRLSGSDMCIQYSAITERKSKAYKACVMSDQWNQLCVVSAMDDGKCCLWVICNCLCGVKVNVMEEWPLVVGEQKFMARICDTM